MDSERTAFLLLEPQRRAFLAEHALHEAVIIRAKLEQLLVAARRAGALVAMVRAEADPSSAGEWEIEESLAPQSGDVIVDRLAPDAFEETELGHDLFEAGVRRLVVAGFRSDGSIIATVKRATDLGFDVTLVADAHSTADDGVRCAADIVAATNAELASNVVLVPAAHVEW